MKKETLEEVAKEFSNNSAVTNYEEGINVGKYQGFIQGAKWQQEQYTIEEQHVRHTIDELDKAYIKGFNEGSTYQQERSYSEEDLKSAFLDGWELRDGDLPFPKAKKKWLEQFKKK